MKPEVTEEVLFRSRRWQVPSLAFVVWRFHSAASRNIQPRSEISILTMNTNEGTIIINTSHKERSLKTGNGEVKNMDL